MPSARVVRVGQRCDWRWAPRHVRSGCGAQQPTMFVGETCWVKWLRCAGGLKRDSPTPRRSPSGVPSLALLAAKFGAPGPLATPGGNWGRGGAQGQLSSQCEHCTPTTIEDNLLGHRPPSETVVLGFADLSPERPGCCAPVGTALTYSLACCCAPGVAVPWRG